MTVLMQFNVAAMRAPFDDPLFDDFKAGLKMVHAEADRWNGFMGRLHGENEPAGYIQPYPDAPLIMGNMSAWESYGDVFSYTFSDVHLEIMKHKRKWFQKYHGRYNVLYYITEDEFNVINGDRALALSIERLEYYQHNGPSAYGFGFGEHDPAYREVR